MQIIKQIIEYILTSNVINFCLMIWILAFLCKKFNISEIFSNSVKSIENNIEKSKNEKLNAGKLVKESEDMIAHLPQDIEDIEKLGKQKSEIYIKQLEGMAQSSINKIFEEIENVKSIEEKKSSNSLVGYSFKKSIERAESNIVEKLKSNPDLHYKFIEKSLNELDGIQL